MKRAMLTIAALSAALAVFADDEAVSEEAAVSEEIVPVAQTNDAPRRMFTALPLCRRIEGQVFVRKPGKDWEPAEEGRFYPFGTYYRTEKGGALDLAFGPWAIATIADGAAIGTQAQAVGTQTRTIIPVNGKIELKLPDNLPEGMFFVSAPGFTVKNPAGTAIITYEDKGDGDEATILCKTGSLGVEGRHFDIPAMRAADKMRIRTSLDHLFTSLHGETGNYVVNVDQGLCSREELGDDGRVQVIVEKGNLAWHLTPHTRVIINRSVPAIGERMSVHTMTFDAAGEKRNERAFTEDRAEVNSGELVVNRKPGEAEELAKKAAEMTETTAAADTEEVEEAPVEKAKPEPAPKEAEPVDEDFN